MMQGPVKYCCDLGSFFIAVGTIAGYLPIVAGTLLSILGCVHYGLQIFDWYRKYKQ